MVELQTVAAARSLPVNAVDAWKVIGDIGGLASWVPGVASVRVEESTRTITFSDGATSKERVDEYDAAGRRYSYIYLEGPLPVVDYRSALIVTASPANDAVCTVRWNCEFGAEAGADGEWLERVITRAYETALDSLVQVLDGGEPPVGR